VHEQPHSDSSCRKSGNHETDWRGVHLGYEWAFNWNPLSWKLDALVSAKWRALSCELIPSPRISRRARFAGTFSAGAMASSSSSLSGGEIMNMHHSKLRSEHQTLRKEIKPLKLAADGREHDLQIEQTASSFVESTVIGRTKKLATLFGGMLKSDKELVEQLETLVAQISGDEAVAAELRGEIEKCK
jgi:hypothetical protein